MQERLDDEVSSWAQVMDQETTGIRKDGPPKPGICLIVPHRGDGLPKQRDLSAILSDHANCKHQIDIAAGEHRRPPINGGFAIVGD